MIIWGRRGKPKNEKPPPPAVPACRLLQGARSARPQPKKSWVEPLSGAATYFEMPSTKDIWKLVSAGCDNRETH